VLYQLLAGVRPFDGPTPFAIVQAHVSQPVPRLRDDVPAPLAAVVERALAKRPQDRFATADAMRAALRVASDPAAMPARRRRRWWPLVFAGAVLAGALSLGGMCWRGREHADVAAIAVPPQIDAAIVDAEPAADVAVSIDAHEVAPDARPGRRRAAKSCQCAVLLSEQNLAPTEGMYERLCKRKRREDCVCNAAFRLCPQPWVPCEASGCPEDNETINNHYCPDMSPPGVPGATCTGYPNEKAPLETGMLTCDCSDVDFTYRGENGDPCSGYGVTSPRKRKGVLDNCQ
jgi:hypothetical protein